MKCISCKNKDETGTLIQSICQAIVDKKGTNVITIDVRDISSFTDYFIIAEGTVARHIQALYREIEDVLKKSKHSINCVEGNTGDGEWVVLDVGNVVVHLFTHDMRMRYCLEEVWKEGKLVEVPIDYKEDKYD